MDQIKVGKFIAECRKSKKMTQAELAEKLNITDRAISKWENGRGMPDSSIMLELCGFLGISVNELLSGEMIEMKAYDKKAEENLLEMKKEQENYNKKMLMYEWVIGITCTLSFLVIFTTAMYMAQDVLIRVLLIIIATVILLIGICFAIKIEAEVGYYECKKCHHKYVPKYNDVFFAMHFGRTRYLQCPKCGEKSWNKKVIK